MALALPPAPKPQTPETPKPKTPPLSPESPENPIPLQNGHSDDELEQLVAKVRCFSLLGFRCGDVGFRFRVCSAISSVDFGP